MKFIFFISAAIALAAVWNFFGETQAFEQLELASESDEKAGPSNDHDNSIQQLMADLQLPSVDWNEQSSREIRDCNCSDTEKMAQSPRGPLENPLVPWGRQLAGRYLDLEQVKTCKPSRNYLEADLAKMSPLLTQSTTENFGEFPRLCMTYIQRQFMPTSENNKNWMFSKCASKNGTPAGFGDNGPLASRNSAEHGNNKPCVTESYVNALYNSYTGLLACLGIPQQNRLAKFMLESGAHYTVLGKNGDSGFGQIVGGAIYDANKEMAAFKTEIENSDNRACRRFWPLVKELKPVEIKADQRGNLIKSTANRCGLLTLPSNPLLQSLYFAIKDEQDRKGVLRRIQTRTFNLQLRPGQKTIRTTTVAKLFVELGMPAESLSEEPFIQMMSMLSYHMGGNGSMNMLINFLKMKEFNEVNISADDFNFMSIDDPQTAEIAKTVFTGKKGISLKAKRNTAVANLKAKGMETKITFPQYLMLYQDGGGPGYLSWVANRAHQLNGVFKEGKCVPEKFLSL